MMAIDGPVSLIAAALAVWFGWRITEKAGFSGLWSLVLLFPGINVIAMWLFALIPWPVHGEAWPDDETVEFAPSGLTIRRPGGRPPARRGEPGVPDKDRS